ncbi:N-formylglutamate amidohydrolase (plasmid) [Rhizobium sp. CB3060]|uniref:N-formylglutamate amidohydrolase n=1 Tax=Rhizobium sp. CB3060 TaxID=3138255 RepID=UPI0021A34538|nr:N-formylglutamate amidohydrolase [Rhizobium tropici]UWU25648.1 N-formylglutamate amidohydrolase [Rhizobium tropici]
MDALSFLDGRTPVSVRNEDGSSRIVVVCEHASNYVPRHLHGLGLPPEKLVEHIAWDPGALGVAQQLADMLDAPLVFANVSRLVLDINRHPDHPGSIVKLSEATEIPGNKSLSDAERLLRCDAIYHPFHAALEDVVGKRSHRSPWVISIHSFTPVYKGVPRPWHVGILHNHDTRLSHHLLDGLSNDPDLVVGDNEPYTPTDGVYHTIERHTLPYGFAGAMIEIRNDLISNKEDEKDWASRFNRILKGRLTPE